MLDCDTKNEVDDQFAIAHALGLPPGVLDVRGVISVHDTTADGPTSRNIYQEEAERVVGLCNSYVPCIPGAEYPMEDRETPVRSEGLDFLIEEARSGLLTIIATGPATDVASLLLVAPDVRENIRVVWLGGFGDEGSYERFKMGGELNGAGGHRLLAQTFRGFRRIVTGARMVGTGTSWLLKATRLRKSYGTSEGPSQTTWRRFSSRRSKRTVVS